ncbi:GntR family transcriptional regulator [Christensenella tenuis]|uniref:GntR family transcriptional regulator n=1 Tax=Christensenella tenuis TaxID=2763033 RepID=A0ABR7EHL9_9FIRM|nr:GntR family transcriptional regulator [Christensenella tenuis]MBC5648534.1 GntR family transcriptional regulator [Christensenella tenuis]
MPFQNDHIDKNIPVPMYYQLKTIILEAIRDERFKPGDVIPTEAEFSEMFGISRTTIRQAIGELVMEGYLYRVKSKGTFVAQPKVQQAFISRIQASHELVREQNMVPTTRVLMLAMERASREAAAALQMKEHAQAVKLVRLRYVDEEPILISESYLPLPLCKAALETDMEHCGLYEFLDKAAETQAVRSVRSLTAIAAGKYEADMMRIERGAPVQMTKSISYNAQGVPVEFTVSKFRGDRNEFVVELNI